MHLKAQRKGLMLSLGGDAVFLLRLDTAKDERRASN